MCSLARRLAIEMPIVEQVYALLYTGKPPRQVVADLLARLVEKSLLREFAPDDVIKHPTSDVTRQLQGRSRITVRPSPVPS